MPASNPLFITTPDTLSRQERALFDALSPEPHRVFTKSELRCHGSTRDLDSTASRLRAKLAAFDGRRSPVNVWGVGYRLEDPPEHSDRPRLATSYGAVHDLPREPGEDPYGLS